MDKARNFGLKYCRSNPVRPENIPSFLKSLDQWVIWKAFNEKPSGKFDKVPICPRSGYKVNHLDEEKQLPFVTALQAHQSGSGDGIGISLTGKALNPKGFERELYLVGVDLDRVMDSADRIAAAKSTCKSLNSYAEVSPSGTGIRIFAFSKKLVGNGQSPMGEMYSSGRFLTVTGHGKPHEIQDATIELAKLEKTWWPKESRSENYPDLEVPPKPVFPDTPKNRATLYIWLRNLSADCDYERYRDCVWAILSTEWKDAEEMAYRWCKSTPERFDPTSFDLVVNSYSAEHSNPITIRSLAYWSNSVIRDE